MKREAAAGMALALAGLAGPPAFAAPAYSCGSFAMAGGAELLCSHVDPKAPAQMCTYSWALLTSANTPSVIQGSFLLTPGLTNSIVYQGFGFASALSNPIVLCEGRRSAG